jgi:hypothetical protein
MQTSTLPSVGVKVDRRQALLASSVALLTPAVLVACGGTNNDAPEVTLYVTPNGGKVGATISLSVEVESDIGIKEVIIYRITSNAESVITTFNTKPYLVQTTIPDAATGTVIEYKARAKDSDDQTTDSSKVSITVSA